MMKKFSIFCICIVLFFLCVVGCEKNEKNENKNIVTENGSIVNQNSGVISMKIVNGFKFENVSLVTKDGITTFLCYMTNENNKTINVSKVKLIMKNKKDELITNIELNIERDIRENETVELSSILKKDLTNVDIIDYEIVK